MSHFRFSFFLMQSFRLYTVAQFALGNQIDEKFFFCIQVTQKNVHSVDVIKSWIKVVYFRWFSDIYDSSNSAKKETLDWSALNVKLIGNRIFLRN